jgi:hypothetical protein
VALAKRLQENIHLQEAKCMGGERKRHNVWEEIGFAKCKIVVY